MLPLAFMGSPADIAIILVLALIVFGPKRLPEIGKQIGQAMREMRKITDELTGAAHSVHAEVESVYKPVMSPPHEYGNPYLGTSSATVEKAVTRRTYDQDPADLMAPVVPPALKPEVGHENSLEMTDSGVSNAADKKGH